MAPVALAPRLTLAGASLEVVAYAPGPDGEPRPLAVPALEGSCGSELCVAFRGHEFKELEAPPSEDCPWPGLAD